MRTPRAGGAELLPPEVLLAAIAEHGPQWPAQLGPRYEQYVLDRAVDRELLAGNISDGITLTDRGRALLTTVPEGAGA